MYELAERDDDGRLEDDEEQRVQRHVLDRAVGGAIDGSRHAAGPVAGRSQACGMPTSAASRAERGKVKRPCAGWRMCGGHGGLVPWDAPGLSGGGAALLVWFVGVAAVGSVVRVWAWGMAWRWSQTSILLLCLPRLILK